MSVAVASPPLVGAGGREDAGGSRWLVGGVAAELSDLLAAPVGFIRALMAVAIIWVHLPIGYFWMTGGLEYPLMWGLVALAFVFRGGGRYSLDALIGREI